MSYNDFVANLGKYVGKVVAFTIRFKSTGDIYRSERYVWDDHNFCPLKADSMIDVLNVEVVRDGRLDRSVPGITAVH